MAKSKEELAALKEKVEALREEIRTLTEEELRDVSGGILPIFKPQIKQDNKPGGPDTDK